MVKKQNQKNKKKNKDVKSKMGDFLNKIGFTRKRFEVFTNILDITFWVILVLGAYWYGTKTGSCENIERACYSCDNARAIFQNYIINGSAVPVIAG